MGRTNINIKILQSHMLTISMYENYSILQTFAKCCHEFRNTQIAYGFYHYIFILFHINKTSEEWSPPQISKCKLIFFSENEPWMPWTQLWMDPWFKCQDFCNFFTSWVFVCKLFIACTKTIKLVTIINKNFLNKYFKKGGCMKFT